MTDDRFPGLMQTERAALCCVLAIDDCPVNFLYRDRKIDFWFEGKVIHPAEVPGILRGPLRLKALMMGIRTADSDSTESILRSIHARASQVHDQKA